jgi:hypothetical protein
MATETTEQIVRESPEVEAYKLNMMKAATALQPPTLPQYQVAGFTPQQTAAMQAGQQGIGAYSPYLQAGQAAMTAGTATTGEAADVLRGSDTRGQFAAAQQAMNNAAVPASQIGQLANVAGSGLGYLSSGAADIDRAQQMAQLSAQANLQPSQQMMMNAAQQAQQAAYQPGFGQAAGALGAAQNQAMAAGPSNFGQSNALLGQGLNASNLAAQQAAQAAQQPGFGQAQGTLQSGIGALQGASQMYDPSSVQGYMNPYQQQVIDESIKQINRQGAQSNEALRTQAIRAGAFGGGRNAVMQAEMQRNLADAKNAAITNTLSQGYGTAQQQAQSAFEQQQQRQLAQGQGLTQTGATAGSLASQQGQLGLQAAQQQFQAAGYDANTAMQMAQLQQTQQQQGLAQSQAMQGIGALYGQQAAQQAGLQQAGAQYAGNVGQNLGAQEMQQAGLGQSAASLYGQLGSQQAGLAGQQAGIAGQQAGILGQQSQLQQQLGQGIGSLAGQQFGIGSQMAQNLGALGGQLGQLGVQQGAMGQAAQQLGQGDVNFLYNLGAQQQKQQQAVLDAQRATSMQTAMQPYQQLAFQSDIYKGAPSTQMAMTSQAAPTPSPFQQIAGVGTGILGLAGAANSANKLF